MMKPEKFDAEQDQFYRAMNLGLSLYGKGQFFEAHEIWETLWLDALGRTKSTLQALIQIAAAAHKDLEGVRTGVSKLLAKAGEKLEELRQGGPSWLGIDLVALLAEVTRALEAADARCGDQSIPFVPPRLPERVAPEGDLSTTGPGSARLGHE